MLPAPSNGCLLFISFLLVYYTNCVLNDWSCYVKSTFISCYNHLIFIFVLFLFCGRWTHRSRSDWHSSSLCVISVSLLWSWLFVFIPWRLFCSKVTLIYLLCAYPHSPAWRVSFTTYYLRRKPSQIFEASIPTPILWYQNVYNSINPSQIGSQ